MEICSDITAHKMKFSITDFFSKCDQIRRKLRIWSHLLKKSVMENFIFVQCILNTGRNVTGDCIPLLEQQKSFINLNQV